MASWVIEYVHLYKVPTYLELHTSHSHQKSVSGSYSQGVSQVILGNSPSFQKRSPSNCLFHNCKKKKKKQVHTTHSSLGRVLWADLKFDVIFEGLVRFLMRKMEGNVFEHTQHWFEKCFNFLFWKMLNFSDISAM